MIMIFNKSGNGRPAHCEIMCQEQDAETHRQMLTAAGWTLTSVVAPRSEEWKNTSMKLMCIHGSVCENSQCSDCFDFEM